MGVVLIQEEIAQTFGVELVGSINDELAVLCETERFGCCYGWSLEEKLYAIFNVC